MTSILEKALPVWPAMKDLLFVPHNEKSYDKLSKMLDEIIDETGEDENHPLSGLAEILGNLLEKYENENVKIPDSSPVAVLRYLMNEHCLPQKDLSLIGSQGIVSEILSGKRMLNINQIKKLAKRFNVSPAVLI